MPSIVPPIEDVQLAPPSWFGFPFPSHFWDRVTIRAIRPMFVYAGPMPRTDGDMLAIQAWQRRAAYVYVIVDRGWDVLYVGKTVNPTGRFSKHRSKKAWWSEAHGLYLLGVDGRNKQDAGTAALRVESLAIRDLYPIHNIAGVAR